MLVNGHYLSTETDFLERRRRGLVRFMNSIVRHPVLRGDDIVVAFITVPTELSLWRKSASIPLVEEFTDRELPPDLESRIPAELESQLDRIRLTLTPAINIYVYLIPFGQC
jgi:sorting nexin-8